MRCTVTCENVWDTACKTQNIGIPLISTLCATFMEISEITVDKRAFFHIPGLDSSPLHLSIFCHFKDQAWISTSIPKNIWYNAVEFNLSLLWKRETNNIPSSPLVWHPPTLVTCLLVHSVYDFLVWKPNSNLILLCFSKFSVYHSIDFLPYYSNHTLVVWWQKEPVTFLRRGSLETSLLRLMRVTENHSCCY